jgi:hypothetical protein
VQWTPFEPVEPAGWLFWRPKSNDGGTTWYVPAYWHAHGKSILLRSTDGRAWQQVSVIHEGDGNDETDIEFLPDGRLLATARLEITPDTILGNYDGQTAIAVAAPPFTEWTTQRSRVTRLDGPNLFALDGTIYAIARYQPDPNGFLTRMGGILSRKRTASTASSRIDWCASQTSPARRTLPTPALPCATLRSGSTTTRAASTATGRG